MSRGAPVSAVVIGAISADVERAAAPRPGGVVHYAGLAFARLGARTHVVTSVHPSRDAELLGPLRAEGVQVFAQASQATTICENDYSGRQDAHELREVSDPIRAESVCEQWRRADVAQIGPLHRADLEPETVHVLQGLRGIDLQGLVRERGPEGTRLAPFARLGEFVRGVPVVKVSEHELPFVLEGESAEAFMKRFGVRELLITRGARGAWVRTREETLPVPAAPARRLHPTGAGDVFLATYLLARVRGFPPGEAARLASAVCAAKIETGMVPRGFSLTGDER